MNKISSRINFYLLKAIAPYFFFFWILLSVILFVQQGAKYSDLFFNRSIPSILIWQISLALLPTVIAFTCPMAVLVGVLVGMAKLSSDNEIVAIKNAGISNWQLTTPILFGGTVLTLFTIAVNLYGIPLSSQIIRKIIAQTAIYKLESPLEPGAFNTQIQGYTVYVKAGDIKAGSWKNIFIYNEDKKKNETRLITSSDGRLDYSGNQSEVVLNNALVTTFPSSGDEAQKISSERHSAIRFSIKTKRDEMLLQLGSKEEAPEEKGIGELIKLGRSKLGKERIEIDILWQRRLMLAVTPILFALLGFALATRFGRRNVRWNILLALGCSIIYYLIALLAEQFARLEIIKVSIAEMIPVLATMAAIIWFYRPSKARRVWNGFNIKNSLSRINPKRLLSTKKTNSRHQQRVYRILSLRDSEIIFSLTIYYLLVLAVVTSIYLIFTAFELWKFAGLIEQGTRLLAAYLAYLIPFIYLQIAPTAAMIAVMIVFLIKSRTNQLVSWSASGQSLYRLLLPVLIWTLFLGAINWIVQETISPAANQIQDKLRLQIRNKGLVNFANGDYWIANENRIYKFSGLADDSDDYKVQKLQNLTVYEFSGENGALNSITESSEAGWEKGKIILGGNISRVVRQNDFFFRQNLTGERVEITESYNPFYQIATKPNYLTSAETKEYLKTAESLTEQLSFKIALQKKYATVVLPLILVLFTVPFALIINHKSQGANVGLAIALWLVFVGMANAFEQYGLSGKLNPWVSVWLPVILFGIVGLYLLTRIRT